MNLSLYKYWVISCSHIMFMKSTTGAKVIKLSLLLMSLHNMLERNTPWLGFLGPISDPIGSSLAHKY
jgi:hypothetical protein